jgi:magnesium chelatase subunit H
MLKRLPKLFRFIPGTAQDVRNYFLACSTGLRHQM